MIFIRIKIELLILIRKIYIGMFIKSSSDEWLDNKVEDYGKIRKQAIKIEGYLTIEKIDAEKELIIPKGYIFKTLPSLAGKEYIKNVENVIESIKGVYDDVLVKLAETIGIDVNLTLYIDYNASEQGLKEMAITYVTEYFEISNKRELNILYLSELIFYVRKNLDDEITAIKILEPLTDVKLNKDKVIILNIVNVSIERV